MGPYVFIRFFKNSLSYYIFDFFIAWPQLKPRKLY